MAASRSARAAGRHRVGHAGHRHRRLPRRKPAPRASRPPAWPSYVAAYRIGMLASTAGALFLVSGFEGLRLRQGHGAWTRRLSRHGGAGRRRHRDRADRDRAREIRRRREPSTPRTRATIRSSACAGPPPTAPSREFLTRDMAIVALCFVVLLQVLPTHSPAS